MNMPTNQLGQPVVVGDVVALTTTSGKWSRTRIAKVVKIEQESEIRNYDYTNKVYVPTGQYNYRVLVRLFYKTKKYDRVTRTYGPEYYHSYTKRVFGINESVKIDESSLPFEIQEALNDKRK